jgi:hypothetical protein
MKACGQRAVVLKDIEKLGWCRGTEGPNQSGPDKKMARVQKK